MQVEALPLKCIYFKFTYTKNPREVKNEELHNLHASQNIIREIK